MSFGATFLALALMAGTPPAEPPGGAAADARPDEASRAAPGGPVPVTVFHIPLGSLLEARLNISHDHSRRLHSLVIAVPGTGLMW